MLHHPVHCRLYHADKMNNSVPQVLDTAEIATQLKTVAGILTEIRDENRHSTASLKAQMHIMQERLERIDKTSVPLKWNNRIHPDVKPEHDEANVSGCEGIHRECLQENLVHMIDSFDLRGSLLIDELIGDSCLTENEASRIREQTDHRNQTRALALAIGRRSRAKFEHFLRQVKSEYPDIHSRLKQSYESKIGEERPSQCLICVIKRDVDIQDVVDKLCSKSVVDLQFLDHICTSNSNSLKQANADLWDLVFVNIDRSQDRKTKINILMEALYEKYEYIAAKLGVWQRPKLVCHCSMPPLQHWLSSHRNFNDSLTSLNSEISSTSDRDLPWRLNKQGTIDAYDSVSSLDENNIPATVQWLQEQSGEVSSSGVRGPTVSDLNDTLMNLSVGDSNQESSSIPMYERQDTLPFGDYSFSHQKDDKERSLIEKSESTESSKPVNTKSISSNLVKPDRNSGVQNDADTKRKVLTKRRMPSRAWLTDHGHRRSYSDGQSEINLDKKDKQTTNPKDYRRNISMQELKSEKHQLERTRCTSENDILSEVHRQNH